LGVAKTARKLKIKLPTAKSILRAFRSNGKILRKHNIKKRKTIKIKQLSDNLNQELPQINAPTE
jgi:hypothetical protein